MSLQMKKPLKPRQEDCCNSGCNPCILDVYEKQLKLFELYEKSGKTDSLVENAISQLEYSTFYVASNIDLQNEHNLILFKRCSSTSDAKQVIWAPGDHFLFKYSIEVNCTRAYTPFQINVKTIEKYDFAILVKRYLNGVVSNHLCDLTIGDVSLWRGPYGHYKLTPNIYCRIIMIVQGTGITPVYSIIKQILNNEEDMTRILLFYCCKNLKTVLLRDEMYSFKSYWNFHYEVYLGNKLSGPCKYKEPVFPHTLHICNINKFKPFSECDQFIICGSNKFVDYFKQLLLQENIEKDSIVIL